MHTIRNIIIPFLLRDLATRQRRLPRRAQVMMRMISLMHRRALLRITTRNTCAPPYIRRALPAETLPPHTQPAIPPTRHPTRRPRPHGRVLRLEGFPPPGVREGESFEFLLVFLFRRHAVFGARHGFAGFVDVGGPAFLRRGFGEGGGLV